MQEHNERSGIAAISSTYTSPEYTHCLRDARFRYNVYEPEADTFLFLEALDKDAELLRSLAPRRCVEIGCGSGTVITHLRCLLMPPFPVSGEAIKVQSAAVCTAEGGPMFCAVDVNPLALEATGITWTDTLQKHFTSPTLTQHFRAAFHTDVPTTLAAPVVAATAEMNTNVPSASPSAPSPAGGPAASAHGGGDTCALASTFCLHRFHGDLFDPVRDALGGNNAVFDVVLFNPPYVPTSLGELEEAVARKDVITAAWCGGPRGRVVLDRFLQQLPSAMSRSGACYVVLIKENDVADVVAYAQQHFRAHLRQLDVLASSVADSGADAEEEDVIEAEEVAARYTGEHLCVYRLRYIPRYRDHA